MPAHKIFHMSEMPHREAPDGIVSVPLVNKTTCGANITTGTVTFPAGFAVGTHRHNCNEMVMVLSGDCAVVVDGQTTPLKQFDVVHIDEGTWHSFVSTGSTPFTILWVYDCEIVERIFAEPGSTPS